MASFNSFVLNCSLTCPSSSFSVVCFTWLFCDLFLSDLFRLREVGAQFDLVYLCFVNSFVLDCYLVSSFSPMSFSDCVSYLCFLLNLFNLLSFLYLLLLVNIHLYLWFHIQKGLSHTFRCIMYAFC
jgi:hypothetical protein